MKNFATILGLATCFFMACTPSTQLRILQPADITVPDDIQKIGTLDRSVPSSTGRNILEGVLTGESIGADKEGRRAAIAGFSSVLSATPRFEIKQINAELSGSKDGSTMAAPLDWATVEKFCSDYQVDVLAVLEVFDTDASHNRSTSLEKFKDQNKVEHTRTRYNVDRRMEVRAGFRMYNPKTRTIMDEFVTSANRNDGGNGLTENEAMNNLGAPNDAIRNVARRAGDNYARRIAPLYTTETRTLYKKVPTNKDANKKAIAAAKTGKWSEASEIWETMATRSTNQKTKGKASYDLAVSFEARGMLEEALKWAETSYIDHNFKPAKNYVLVVKRRIADQKRLNEQMKSKDKDKT